jgi:hypothetical protein
MNRVSPFTQGQGCSTTAANSGLLDWSGVDFTPELNKPIKFKSFRHAAKMGMIDEWFKQEVERSSDCFEMTDEYDGVTCLHDEYVDEPELNNC